MARRRLAVVVLLPEPVAAHVQAWRRALREPTRAAIAPHITVVPPQNVAADDVGQAVALLDRVAADMVPGLVALRDAATFLPAGPVAFLRVDRGTPVLVALEQALRTPPLDRRTHPFEPHVTVAQELPPAELEAAVAALAGFRASFPVRELVLMEEGRDRVWRPAHHIPMGAAPTVREVPYQQAASVALFLLDLPNVLVGLRTDRPERRYPGVWDALGGKPGEGEALLEALVREVREEADVEPLDVAPLGCFHDGERADAFFVATAWRGTLRNAEPSEHAELAWVPLSEVAGRSMAPTTRRALARLLDVVGGAAGAVQSLRE